MRILRAIVGGETNVDVLVSYRDPSCKNSTEVFRRSLEGNYQPEHLFLLKQSLKLYDWYTELIRECDQEIEEQYKQMTSGKTGSPPPSRKPQRKKKPRKSEPTFDLTAYLYKMAGVDLTGCREISPPLQWWVHVPRVSFARPGGDEVKRSCQELDLGRAYGTRTRSNLLSRQ